MIRLFAAAFLFLLVAQKCQSQYVPDSLPTEIPFKHQIGVALTPFALVLLGGEPFQRKYGLIWRKRLGVSKNLRVSVNMINYNPMVDSPSSLHELTDTGAVMVTTALLDRSLDLRGGLEWFKPYQKHGAVFGMDALVGMRDINRERNYTVLPYDTLSSNNVGLEIENAQPQDFSRLRVALAGVTANFGYALHAGDKFIFHFMWSPQLVYLIPISESFSDVSFSQERFNRGMILDFSFMEFYLSRKF